MTPSHKVARTDGIGGLDDKLAIGAYGLKTMMLDNHRFPGEKRQNQRRKSRTS
jgi:hypothetical protein